MDLAHCSDPMQSLSTAIFTSTIVGWMLPKVSYHALSKTLWEVAIGSNRSWVDQCESLYFDGSHACSDVINTLGRLQSSLFLG